MGKEVTGGLNLLRTGGPHKPTPSKQRPPEGWEEGPLGGSTARQCGRGRTAWAFCPSPLCRPPGKNKEPGQASVGVYGAAKGVLLNGVSPAATARLLPCSGETGRRLWSHFQAKAAPARSTLWAVGGHRSYQEEEGSRPMPLARSCEQ